MFYEIKDRQNNNMLFSCEAASWKEAIAKALNSYADLSSANLSYADLSYADLSYADLSHADLSYANLRYANLSYADLSYADLSHADLSHADLSYANLRYANLRSADLRYADLSYADLSHADLSYANLRYAKGVNKYLSTPLYLLLDQPGLIRAYKLVNSLGEGPYNGGIHYEVREKEYEVENANTNEHKSCGAGINLATLDWCIREWREGYQILIAEFSAADIAAIPIGSDGKFRVHRCRIVGEKDLKEIGVVKEKEAAVAEEETL